ncbi:hypothetical protein ACIQVU_16520 [Lysinibacillus sp. NPDC098008]|uniref:hypothetical protein n=1 Tax=Lysinibacillus sp. NPDC098008 TaxID=3364146 RepID=UPI0037FFD90A
MVDKYDLKTTIHETADGSFIKSLGSDDKSKSLNLNVKFEGINFFSLLRQSFFKPFEISGENIKAFETYFEGITIPNGGKIQTLTVMPLPSKKFKADMFFKGTDHILSEVLIEVFEGFGIIHLRFTHDLISFELNFEEKKFNFKINKFRHLRELEGVVDFLLTLLEGIEPLMLYINETLDGNDSIENKEFELIKMSISENIDSREELAEIKEAIVFLKEVQKHYRITFRNFELNLPNDFNYALDVLRLHMEKSSLDIEKLYFEEKDIIIYEDVTSRQEFIQELTENKKPFNFEYRRHIDTITIFNQTIPIHDELIIRCTDAIISKKLDQNEQQLKFELSSNAKGIVMGFL